MNTYPPMKMEVFSETSAYTIQTPGSYPEESTQHSEHGESLKSRILAVLLPNCASASNSTRYIVHKETDILVRY
jgi:hypothetical protein